MIEGALTLSDYGLVFLLAVPIPLWGYMEMKALRSKLQNGEQAVLPKIYKQNMVVLWAIFVLVMASWLWHDLPFSGLGLMLSQSFAQLLVWVFALLAAAALIVQVWQAKHQQKIAEGILKNLADVPAVSQLLPTTVQEFRLFNGLSVTAGITEEIIYRGYLIWAFAQWVPVWLAAAFALGVFVAGHAYQDSAGSLIKVAMTGLVLTLVYLFSGSLIPAIFLHIVIDVSGAAMVWRARQWQAIENNKSC